MLAPAQISIAGTSAVRGWVRTALGSMHAFAVPHTFADCETRFAARRTCVPYMLGAQNLDLVHSSTLQLKLRHICAVDDRVSDTWVIRALQSRISVQEEIPGVFRHCPRI